MGGIISRAVASVLLVAYFCEYVFEHLSSLCPGQPRQQNTSFDRFSVFRCYSFFAGSSDIIALPVFGKVQETSGLGKQEFAFVR